MLRRNFLKLLGLSPIVAKQALAYKPHPGEIPEPEPEALNQLIPEPPEPDFRIETRGDEATMVFDDGRKLYLGSGKDANIYYDGSDFVLDATGLGEGKLEFKRRAFGR